MVPVSLRRASAVIVATQTAKREVMRFIGVPSEKIHVVHHGVSECFREAFCHRFEPWVDEVVAKYTGGGPYILTVSTLYRLKNYERLIRAFALLKQGKGLKHKLVIVGSEVDLTREELLRWADEQGVRDEVIYAGGLPHQELAPLYLRADLMCYPSLVETFGHPVVEAMASGCPVVTSNVSCLPEVAGGAAELVDPYSVESIAEGMWRILTDPAHRAELLERGLKRSATFSWEKTAARILEVLKMASASRAQGKWRRFPDGNAGEGK